MQEPLAATRTPARGPTFDRPPEEAPDRPPEEGAADSCVEIADLFGRAMRRLHRGSADALSPLGLSRAQGRLVGILAAGPLRMTAIADRLAVVPRTVTDLVDGVEAAGLVARRPDPDDRRSTLVTLTPEGSRLIERLRVARQQSAEDVFGRLPAADRAVLLRVLRAMCADGTCEPHLHAATESAPAEPAATGTATRGTRP